MHAFLLVHPTLISFNMSYILPHNHDIRSSQQVLSRTSDESETIQHRDKRVQEVYSITNLGGNSTRSILSDPTLQSTWAHRAWMVSGCTTLLICLAKSALGVVDSHRWVGPLIACCIGYVLSDLASGIYHWGIDNYGSAKTLVFGNQIDAFQHHHKHPWIITKSQFAKNHRILAGGVTLIVLPINLLCKDPTILAFIGAFSGCIMFSQQFHSWAHGTKNKLPKIVLALQDVGILVSRSQHAAHHRLPYNNNYCLVSGLWNNFLDGYKVFELLEKIFFFIFGAQARSWSGLDLEWTEEIETQSLCDSQY